ncbi:T9SS type A sorting domain-containing protein [Flavobacterium alkalisoli]|uniref:T9SS type A sorting domain-containing protein n=1 Tax=Flavobacterium alkalisoli TaxID=2602769 RepID=A0A5B9G0N9_9FLAO|nr:T9SS type A sorting domain-containing protein [Flavobacterium alkalisoli]QEE50627.1 T9SS type A sorting domain-containing protein [Flavobacterium alkalisoli]
MKKKLLLGAFLLGSFLTVKAQETISFETTEGYTLGSLNDQNEWGLTQIDEQGTTIAGVEVNDVMASDGTMSVSITKDAAIGNQQNANMGAFSPAISAPYNVISLSFDFYIATDSDETTEGSDYAVILQSNTQNALTSRLQFRFDNTIAVVDIDSETNEPALLLIEGAEYTSNEWHTVTIDYDFQANTINYTMDDVLLFEGTAFSGTAIDQMVLLHDNWAGTTFYIDNVMLDGTLGVNEQLLSKFSIYPNPASDVINIANAENILVNGVEIVDLNGRVVKSVNLNGVTEAQINISDLSSGMYLMNVSSDQGTTTKKIVKK